MLLSKNLHKQKNSLIQKKNNHQSHKSQYIQNSSIKNKILHLINRISEALVDIVQEKLQHPPRAKASKISGGHLNR